MEMVKCTRCNKPCEPMQYVIYYADGKPVYNKKCNDCLREIWSKYREELNERS